MDDTEIEAEILQTEEINYSISNAKAKIVQGLKPTTPAVIPPQRTTPPVLVHEDFTWLPKLDWPCFTGNHGSRFGTALRLQLTITPL